MKALACVTDYPRTAAGLAGAGLAWTFDVLTPHGLACALFLESGDGLLWPTATRVVWWVIFGVLGWSRLARLTWREGRLLLGSRVALFAAALIDGVRRVSRRVAWWSAGFASIRAQLRAEQDRRVERDRHRDIVPDVSGPVRATAPEPVDGVPAAA